MNFTHFHARQGTDPSFAHSLAIHFPTLLARKIDKSWSLYATVPLDTAAAAGAMISGEGPRFKDNSSSSLLARDEELRR